MQISFCYGAEDLWRMIMNSLTCQKLHKIYEIKDSNAYTSVIHKKQRLHNSWFSNLLAYFVFYFTNTRSNIKYNTKCNANIYYRNRTPVFNA